MSSQAVAILTLSRENNEVKSASVVLESLAEGAPLDQISPDDLWYFHGWLESVIEAAYDLHRKAEQALREAHYDPPGGPYIP